MRRGIAGRQGKPLRVADFGNQLAERCANGGFNRILTFEREALQKNSMGSGSEQLRETCRSGFPA
jgi:hypothetical protein